MANSKISTHAAANSNFQHIQEIASMPLSDLQDKTNDVVSKSLRLVGNCCTFVPNWDAVKINEKTYYLYSKKVPAKEASKQYAERAMLCVNRVN
eukprot:6826290-Ditylum_brightwellii.AAC.1